MWALGPPEIAITEGASNEVPWRYNVDGLLRRSSVFTDESTGHPFVNVLGKPFARFIDSVPGAQVDARIFRLKIQDLAQFGFYKRENILRRLLLKPASDRLR